MSAGTGPALERRPEKVGSLKEEVDRLDVEIAERVAEGDLSPQLDVWLQTWVARLRRVDLDLVEIDEAHAALRGWSD